MGDFDNNGVLDISDIDGLMIQVAGGENLTDYDLIKDAMVNTEDIGGWGNSLAGTWIGDANLDGELSSSDMVDVFQAGKYELDVEAGRAAGDWNGGQRFGSGDLVAAFTDGGHELGSTAGVPAVPEPSCEILLGIGILGIFRLHTRR
ncbi:MAG: hypothetical protein KDB27_21555 [Planctomycetales bacterium]|nr:hypothetical protein [Planctomycetales bacterium]